MIFRPVQGFGLKAGSPAIADPSVDERELLTLSDFFWSSLMGKSSMLNVPRKIQVTLASNTRSIGSQDIRCVSLPQSRAREF